MGHVKDITGQKYGKLTVIRQDTISRARTLAAIRDAMSIILGGPVYTGLELAAEIVRRQEAVKDV